MRIQEQKPAGKAEGKDSQQKRLREGVGRTRQASLEGAEARIAAQTALTEAAMDTTATGRTAKPPDRGI
jgi:hypothetical protein